MLVCSVGGMKEGMNEVNGKDKDLCNNIRWTRFIKVLQDKDYFQVYVYIHSLCVCVCVKL